MLAEYFPHCREKKRNCRCKSVANYYNYYNHLVFTIDYYHHNYEVDLEEYLILEPRPSLRNIENFSIFINYLEFSRYVLWLQTSNILTLVVMFLFSVVRAIFN